MLRGVYRMMRAAGVPSHPPENFQNSFSISFKGKNSNANKKNIYLDKLCHAMCGVMMIKSKTKISQRRAIFFLIQTFFVPKIIQHPPRLNPVSAPESYWLNNIQITKFVTTWFLNLFLRSSCQTSSSISENKVRKSNSD